MNSILIVDVCAPEVTGAKHSTSSIKIHALFTLSTSCAFGSGLKYCFLIALRGTESVWVEFVEIPALFGFFDFGGKGH